ncbi:MAG: DinB family protein [Candidatus Limnocylindria bacterium]
MTEAAWLVRLEAGAPDVVACWRAYADGGPGPMRDELALRVRPGRALGILVQLEAVAAELAGVLDSLPDDALAAPGGEADWNVSQAFAHTTAARRFLASWAALAARGRWPADDPPRPSPGIPGPADAGRDMLHLYLDKSRRAQSQAAESIADHETDRCPMDNPFIEGRLRCGEWLLYTGVHDLMHLEQLHRLVDHPSG